MTVKVDNRFGTEGVINGEKNKKILPWLYLPGEVASTVCKILDLWLRIDMRYGQKSR